jgi:hypothetical protein
MELLEEERWLVVQGGLEAGGWLKEGRKRNVEGAMGTYLNLYCLCCIKYGRRTSAD